MPLEVEFKRETLPERKATISPEWGMSLIVLVRIQRVFTIVEFLSLF